MALMRFWQMVLMLVVLEVPALRAAELATEAISVFMAVLVNSWALRSVYKKLSCAFMLDW
jgi:hypothetical protein